MSKKEKIITIVVVAALVIAALIGLVMTNPQAKTFVQELFGAEPETQPQEQDTPTFTVIVVHSSGEEKTFTYAATSKYVGTVLQEEGLIEGPIESYGIYIQVVDGERAVYEENSAYWAFYVGDEYAMTGIDQTEIDPTVVYKLVYTAE